MAWKSSDQYGRYRRWDRRRVYHDVYLAVTALVVAPLHAPGTGEGTDFVVRYSEICLAGRAWWFPGRSVRSAWERVDAAAQHLLAVVAAARAAGVIPAGSADVVEDPPMVRQAREGLADANEQFAAAARIDLVDDVINASDVN